MYVGKYHSPNYFYLFFLDKLYRLHVIRPCGCRQSTPFPKLFSSISPLSSSTGFMSSGIAIADNLRMEKNHSPSSFHPFSPSAIHANRATRLQTTYACKKIQFSQLFSSILPLSSSTGYMPSGHDIADYLMCLGKHNLPLFSPCAALQVTCHQATILQTT